MTPHRKIASALSLLAAAAALSGALSVALPAQPETAAEGGGSCRYDRAKMLALDYQRFDQTPGHGWREITAGDKCSIEAADLVRDYRTATNFPNPMLYWHEGQLRALGGAVGEAVSLMELSRPFEASVSGWGEYVNATIAFLQKDRAAYDKARAALAANSGPFLELVDRLGQCFDKSYRQSYRACEK